MSKTVSGFFWSFLQQGGTQGINVIVQILLARLLAPEAFGIIAILQIFISISFVLIDGGVTQSLIRTKNIQEDDYGSVFLLNLGMSLIVYALLFFSAPLIAQLYENDILTNVIRVFGLSIIFQAFSGVQVARLVKEMNFKRQMLIEIPSTLMAGITGVVLAFSGYGVWSLVIMIVAKSFFRAVQFWFYTGWRPGMYFNITKLKAHFNFGYKLTLSTLMGSLTNNLHYAIVGLYYAPASLGYFYQSKTLSQYPVNNLQVALTRVTYPLFSALQDNDEKMNETFQRMLKAVFFIVVPIMLMLILYTETIFKISIGEKWLPAANMFKVFCFASIFKPVGYISQNILKAKGKSGLLLKLQIVKKVLAVIILFSFVHFGIFTLAIALSATIIIEFFILMFYAGKIVKYELLSQIKVFLIYLFWSLLVSLPLFTLSILFSEFQILFFVFQCILIPIAYIFVCKKLYLIDDIFLNLYSKMAKKLSLK